MKKQNEKKNKNDFILKLINDNETLKKENENLKKEYDKIKKEYDKIIFDEMENDLENCNENRITNDENSSQYFIFD